MADIQAYPNADALDDVSSRLAASRLSQRLSRDSTTLGSIRSVRSSRIEKPRSTQNSPQGLQRRRTTSLAQAHPLHRQTPYDVQPQHYGIDITQPSQARQSARPVTWHPALFQQSHQFMDGYPQMEASTYISIREPQYQHMLPFPQQVAPDVTGVSQAVVQPWPDQTQMPSNEATWNTLQTLSGNYVTPSDPATLQDSSWYAPGYTSALPVEPIWVQQVSPEWVPSQQPPDLIEDSTPPIQQSNSTTVQTESGEKVLVGLGLYDPPATPPHPFTYMLGQGKGLKLEEPWAPPTDPEDEDGEGEDDDEVIIENNTASPYSLPMEPQDVVTQTQKQGMFRKETQWMTQQEGSGAVMHVYPVIEEQPFFLGTGEDVGGEWWYDPAAGVRAQEQGFGQGWLSA